MQLNRTLTADGQIFCGTRKERKNHLEMGAEIFFTMLLCVIYCYFVLSSIYLRRLAYLLERLLGYTLTFVHSNGAAV